MWKKLEAEHVIGLALIALCGLFLVSIVWDADRMSQRKHKRELARIQALEAGVDPLALIGEAGEE